MTPEAYFSRPSPFYPAGMAKQAAAKLAEHWTMRKAWLSSDMPLWAMVAAVVDAAHTGSASLDGTCRLLCEFATWCVGRAGFATTSAVSDGYVRTSVVNEARNVTGLASEHARAACDQRKAASQSDPGDAPDAALRAFVHHVVTAAGCAAYAHVLCRGPDAYDTEKKAQAERLRDLFPDQFA